MIVFVNAVEIEDDRNPLARVIVMIAAEEEEDEGCVFLTQKQLNQLLLNKDIELKLSTRPEKRVGSDVQRGLGPAGR